MQYLFWLGAQTELYEALNEATVFKHEVNITDTSNPFKATQVDHFSFFFNSPQLLQLA